ncbi:MAG TPA: lysophospholipid acyltransferase family protein [Acidimicrobiales bacterium]|nr:lysophospholipid acyltransferase family protein [Acidimicrobiales bacterium]
MKRVRADLALYRFVRAVVVTVCRLMWRPKIVGRENIPTDGPYVLAPVHRSNIDTFLVAGLAKGRLRYMGKDSLWKVRWIGAFFNALGAFPVHRGSADREALRRCIDVVEAGEPLVIFPEGTRQSGPDVQPLFEGAAYVAARTGVPIVPVGIGGSERAMPKGSKFVHPVKTSLVVGTPIPAPAGDNGGRAPRRAIHDTTEALHAELQRLFDAAQAAAGQ